MKKHIILVILIAFTCSLQAQVVRGLRIGYIDMEYILKNVPDYTEAKNQLEQKAQKWKQEISAKNNEITKLKESLKTERVLLTKELIEEREEEIAFQEKELMDYQEKRFGPNGDLMRFNEDEFKLLYPHAFEYLKSNKIDSKNILLKASRGIALEQILEFID